MSLDVYLKHKGVQRLEPREYIFIREHGATKEIDREEWDRRFPDCEPITVYLEGDDEQVYTRNITHNLNTMAGEAGIHEALWRPDEIGITMASQLIQPLRAGLDLLKGDPERFKMFNPENGWGDYDALVAFVEDYLAACEQYPSALVEVSR